MKSEPCPNSRSAQAAVGFRIKSGWAVAALVGGARQTPALLDLRRVELSDPAVPDARQPFHAALAAHTLAGRAESQRLVGVVDRHARASLAELFEVFATGHQLIGAGLVVGSEVDPATIANEHIRAHAEEGRLFRTVVGDAAAREGLPVSIHVDKTLLDNAARVLERSPDQLKRELTALGREHVGAWRADEKHAALGAWLALYTQRTWRT